MRSRSRPRSGRFPNLVWLAVGILLTVGIPFPAARAAPASGLPAPRDRPATSSAVANFSSALDRLVALLGVAGGGLLSLVWARVALSWFSNDLAKKVQAKDRARDALIGTLLFTAAVTGLFWGLSQWVLTGA